MALQFVLETEDIHRSMCSLETHKLRWTTGQKKKKNTPCSHLPLSCRQRRVSFHLAYITFCVCVWLLNQRAASLWGLPVALPHSLEKLRILESMEGLKSHSHHPPSNPSGADAVLITTFLLLDSFRPFK